MAEASSELIYGVLKQVQDRLSSIEHKIDEVKNEIVAVRLHSLAVQQDIQNIYTTLVRHDGRLDRIERRLEIVEPV